MSVAESIKKKLVDAFNPVHLEIVDESHLHAGHSSAPEGGERHFRVIITATVFEGQTQIFRQRRVYNILADEMAGPVHALSLSTLTPDEAKK